MDFVRRSARSPCLATAALAALAVLCARPSAAIVIRHDRPDARSLALGAGHPELVEVGRGYGTLIAPDWVLSAAHVVDGGLSPISGSVRVAGRDVPVRRIVLHPSWVGDLGPGMAELDWVDLALVELARPVRDVAPAAPYSRRDEAGRTVLFVGGGRSGDGREGPTTDDDGIRGATNVVETAEDDWITFLFDAPPGGTDLEGISGPGDSGGPALLDVDGKRFIVGVGSRNDYLSQGIERECVYGTREVYARVSSALPWIHATMASASSPDDLAPVDDATLLATPAGRAAVAFIRAYDSGGREALLAFARERRLADAARMIGTEVWATGWSEQRRRTGPLTPAYAVSTSALKLWLLVASGDGRWRSIHVEVDGEPPYRVRELAVARESRLHGQPLPDPAGIVAGDEETDR